MIALGDLSPIETAQAALQEKIGDFLSARARLIRLQNNPSLTVQGQARGLYAAQLQLEDQLYKDILPKIQAIKSGVWNLSDVVVLGAYTANIGKQINDVKNLEGQAGIVQPTGLINDQTAMIGVPALLLGGLAIGMWLNR